MKRTRLSVVIYSIMLVLMLPLLSTAQEKVKKTTIDCKAGKEYKIELASTPSTGYRWSVGSPYDTTLLVLKNKTFIAPKDTTQGGKGKAGTEVFTFKALEKGQVTVRMVLKADYARKVERAEDYLFIISK